MTKKNLTFEQALPYLKNGKRISRSGWNGKDMWIAMSGELEGKTISAENFWCEHNKNHALENDGKARVLPHITMKTATGDICLGWLASSLDIFANDWFVLS